MASASSGLLGSPAVAVAAQPTIRPRSEWGEDLRPTGPLGSELPGGVSFLLVHHTAGANGYPPVAYNFLVDAYGGIWEGRQGSLAGPVKGDATGGSQGFAQMAATPRGDGYWLVTGDGGVHPFGSARLLGRPDPARLRSGRAVGIAASPGGYWVVATR